MPAIAQLAAALLTTALAARPNIIWMQTDSMDGRLLDSTSPYWYKVAQKNLKGLAENGVNFVHTYSASPQCVPSRTAMITSRYVHEAKTWNNGQGLANNTVTGELDTNCVYSWDRKRCNALAVLQNVSSTMLDSIGGAGYDLTLRGRFDVGAGVMDNCGTVWKDSSDCTGDGFHGGPDLSILTRAADIRKPTKGDPMKDVVDDDADPYGNDQAHIDEGVAWFNTHKVNPDVPFFFWVGVYAPHAPFDTNSTYLAAVNASAVDVPPSARVPVADMHPYNSYMSISKDALADYNDTQIMSVRTSYWGAAEEADQMMGRILAAALASRHLDNTIVLYTSDHGEMAMEHRQDFKSSLYEPSVRVPLIIAGFNTSMPIPKGKVVTDAVSHLDIYPTLVEIAGGTLGYGVRGQSLVPYLTTPEPTAAPMAPMRNYAAFEYHGNMGNTASFGIRINNWKYITFGQALFPWIGANYTDILLDLDADPFELTNVIDANPNVATQLRATLKAEFGGREFEGIDKEAKNNDLDLYQQFYSSQYGPARLFTLFTDAYTGFDKDDAARIGEWCGSTPVEGE